MQHAIILLVIGVLIIQPTYACAQARENRDDVQWVIRSKKMTAATGWKYNVTTGKWISNKNVVYNNPALKGLVSQIDQNFNWLQFVKVKNQFETYTLLLYEKQSGFYEFEAIQQGWIAEKRTYWLLLDSAQHIGLVELLAKKIPGEIVLSSTNHGFIRDAFVTLKGEHEYSDGNLLASITTNLRIGSESKVCLKLKYLVEPKGEMIRFLLPDACRLVERNFENSYFETSGDVFRSIMIN